MTTTRRNWTPAPGQNHGNAIKASQLGAVGGAPTDGVTGQGYADTGWEYIDDIAGSPTSGQRWSNTGTRSATVWALIIT